MESLALDTRTTAPQPAPPPAWFRLAGTRGTTLIGEVSEVGDGNVCWTLHPAYAAWLWPLMLKATTLALLMPSDRLEPVEASNSERNAAPRPPTETEKDAILKTPEAPADIVRVYSLTLKGKPASIRKAFPTRTANLAALRYCSKRLSAHP